MIARLFVCILSLIVSELAYSQTGLISTYAGNGTPYYSGDGGAATNASFQPFQLALDANGNLYVADSGNKQILFDNRQSPVVNFGQVCEQAVSHHGIASGDIVPGLCVEVEIVPVPAGAAKEQTPASC